MILPLRKSFRDFRKVGVNSMKNDMCREYVLNQNWKEVFFIISANNIWKFSVSTFNLRKISKLDFILESFKEEIPNNFQTFSKKRRFEGTSSKTSKETPYLYIQSIGIIFGNSNFQFSEQFRKICYAKVFPK